MTKITSRQRILGYLSQHKGVSAQEISRALRVTAANIRYHLAILVSDGRVQNIGFRPEQGRGRPVQVFGLGEAALGDNLTRLVDVLFGKVFENLPDAEIESVLESIAAGLLPMQAVETSGHITRRLVLVIARLNLAGYAARWEAHAAAPRIIFEHCPYAAVIRDHPELCSIDARILRQRLGLNVEQTARLEKTSLGTSFCQFSIKN
ncbi:MAG: helix-turn-helix domain-containing protein [Chloroflexi bacterium]|nr:helix-turn-helix domain-containing protein [Chloroflexota bacterium]